MKQQKDPLNLPDEVLDVDIAFGGYDNQWFNDILKKAKDIGIDGCNSNTKWEKIFSSIFYNGGSFLLNTRWEKEYTDKAVRQFRVVKNSYRPKHQEKTAVCAYMIKILEDGPQG